MRIEPNLNQAALLEMLAQRYGLQVNAVTFVPSGWISACYRVDCADGERFFLKLQPLEGPQPTAATSPVFYLPLTRRLHRSGLLPHIAHPTPSPAGELWTTWAGWRVILGNHIDGELVGHQGMTPAIVRRWMRLSEGLTDSRLRTRNWPSCGQRCRGWSREIDMVDMRRFVMQRGLLG